MVRGKNLLLFFSTLDITEEDIELVNSVYEKAKKKENYIIVWVPIVEEWSEDLWSKIDHQRVQFEMPWYIVQQRKSSVAGIRYIKQEWKFKDKPLLVKINPLSEVKDKNAIYTINRFGVDALFDERVDESNWFASVIKSIKHSVLKTWVNNIFNAPSICICICVYVYNILFTSWKYMSTVITAQRGEVYLLLWRRRHGIDPTF